MGKKKNNNLRIIIGISILAFAIILTLWGTGVFKGEGGLPGLSIGDVPSGCNVFGSGTTDNTFTCESGECDVNGWNDCLEQTGDIPIVTFRTNAVEEDWSADGVWIMYHGSSYIKAGSFGTSGYCRGTEFTPFKHQCISMSGTFSKPRLQIWTSGSSGLSFERGGNADLTSTPKEPYTSNDQELIEGAINTFTCNSPWNVKSSSGAIIDSGEVKYNDKVSGAYQTGVMRISMGETFNFPANINYAIVDATSSCSIDLCNNEETGIIRCIQDGQCMVKSQNIDYCNAGEFCAQTPTGAKCEAPFDTEISYESGLTLNDDVKFTYSISSDSVSSAMVTFKLVDTRNRDQALFIAGPTILTLPETKTITFSNPGIIGTYEIVVEKTYNGNVVEDEVYEFRVGNPLDLVVKIPYSPLTSTNLLTGSAFYIDVTVTENGVPTTDLTNVIMTATLTTPQGMEKSITTPNPITIDDEFRYIFVVNEPGLFEVEAQASKFGVMSNTVKRDSEVREQKIDISYTNMGLIQNSKPGETTVKFETRDPFGNLIGVVYDVKIIPSGASTGQSDIIVTDQVTGEDGVYQFVYNFQSGSYILEIGATAPGYNVRSSLKSPAMNIDESVIPDECSSSDQCSAGNICSDGKCVEKDMPILLYAIVIFAVVFIIILVIIVINLSKKKKPKGDTVEIGGGL